MRNRRQKPRKRRAQPESKPVTQPVQLHPEQDYSESYSRGPVYASEYATMRDVTKTGTSALNVYMSLDRKRALKELARQYNTSASKLVWVGAEIIRMYGREMLDPSTEANGWPSLRRAA